ncbi:MAG: VWA domain-containing protein [Candidatus Omnitrophota bacterium]
MRFAQFNYINSLWLIVMLVLFFVWAFKAKQTLLRKFAREEVLKEITSLVNFRRQVIKFVIIVIVFLLSIIALMRPQWGFQWQEIKHTGLDILIAVDTSKSMLAEDVKPNRLERSKLAIEDLVKNLKGDRVGLIAFSGTAFLQCPLTVDYDGFLLAVNDLNVDSIPRGGTSISSAIQVAMDSYEGGLNKYKVLIIITDGEDHEGDAIEYGERARKDNIKIYCVGIGTAGGELIQIADDGGQKTFLKDREGNVVKSRLNEDGLRQIAIAAGGAYVRSSGAEFGLDFLYNEKLSQLEKREIKSQMGKFYYERFQWSLLFALLLLICESFISDKRKP